MANVGDKIEVAEIEYEATKEGHNWGTCDNCDLRNNPDAHCGLIDCNNVIYRRVENE